MQKKLLIISFCLLMVLALSTASFASFSARTIGLGDKFVTLRGTDAVYGNPGAVNATSDKFTLEFTGAGHAWNNLLINDYISESDKDDLLDGDNLLAGFAGNQGLKLVVGPVTLLGEARESALVDMPSDVADLLLNGNEIGRTYDFAGSKGSGALYGDVGFNFSTEAVEE